MICAVIPFESELIRTSIKIGSGYGYGTVPGGRWTIDTECGHVVVSVSLIRNGYEYGTVPDLCGTIHTESGHVVNSVSWGPDYKRFSSMDWCSTHNLCSEMT